MEQNIVAVLSFGVMAQFVASGLCLITGFDSGMKLSIVLLSMLLAIILASIFRNGISDKMNKSVAIVAIIALFLVMGGFGLIGFAVGLHQGNLIYALSLCLKVEVSTLIFYSPLLACAFLYELRQRKQAA